jgi:hypothetical protein
VADPVSLKPTQAGQALAKALANADAELAANVVLPVLLASSKVPVVADFSQGEASLALVHSLTCRLRPPGNHAGIRVMPSTGMLTHDCLIHPNVPKQTKDAHATQQPSAAAAPVLLC